MILTESDLHAYNRGELPPDAVRQLEDDPLAMQDAARLRAIAEAVRQEAPIAVIGRAETLERLRPRAKPRIGVSGWLWVAGAASVVGLVFVSLPRSERPVFAVREAAFSTADATAPQAKAAVEFEKLSVPRERRAPGPESAAGASVREEARTAMGAAPAAPMALPSQRLQNQNRNRSAADFAAGAEESRFATLSLRVDDPARAIVEAEAIVERYGGIVASRSLATKDEPAIATLRLRLPDGKLEALVERAKRLGTSLGEKVPAESATEAQRTESRLEAMKEEARALERLAEETEDRAARVRIRERLEGVRSAIETETKALRKAEARITTATLELTLSRAPRD